MKRNAVKKIKRHWQLYLVILLPLMYILIFHYYPMYGVQIAFRQFRANKGIMGSEWVGLEHFERFFKSPKSISVVLNTLSLSVFQLVAGFPMPIILALLLNEVKKDFFKKSVQMIAYIPHFISIVVIVGLIIQFLDPRTGVINQFIVFFGGEPTNYMGDPEKFKFIYVLSNIWQHMGYSSIIYTAVLAGVDPQLEEAAVIDGVTRIKKMYYISIPHILPTAIILLIMNMGRIMNVGFQKVYLMQNPLNLAKSEIISTYVYKMGLLNAQYSFSAAVGLFNSVINLFLILVVNKIAKMVGETSLW